MKTLILLVLFNASASYAATSKMHFYDATSFILNNLELPAVGTLGNFERSKTFTDVAITRAVDKNSWGHINFQSKHGSFRVVKAVDPGLFEELMNTPEVKSGFAAQVWVGCKYTLGQKEKNWFSPFQGDCSLSF